MRECIHASPAMRCVLAAWAAISLASCGGGGGGGDATAPASQSLSVSNGLARIEPYERVIALAARKSVAAPALGSVMPAWAIELGPPPVEFTPTKASGAPPPADAGIARQIGAARAVSALATPEDAARALVAGPRWSDVEIIKDGEGIDRVLSARRTPHG